MGRKEEQLPGGETDYKQNISVSELAVADKKDGENYLIQPSHSWAWMIGILSTGGYVDQKGGYVALTNRDDEAVSELFVDLGTTLFGNTVREGVVSTKKGKEARPEFASARYVRTLGDLRSRVWPLTVSQKHAWILEDRDYQWAFMTAAFEARGYVEEKRIRINTVSRVESDFYMAMLHRLGIGHPGILPSHKAPEGIVGVSVSHAADKKLFAENVLSISEVKDEKLDRFRNIQINRKAVPTPDELSWEWVVLRHKLGHVPTSSDIQKLYQEKKTRFSPETYRYAFGVTESTSRAGSFPLARQQLEALTGGNGELFTYKKKVVTNQTETVIFEP